MMQFSYLHKLLGSQLTCFFFSIFLNSAAFIEDNLSEMGSALSSFFQSGSNLLPGNHRGLSEQTKNVICTVFHSLRANPRITVQRLEGLLCQIPKVNIHCKNFWIKASNSVVSLMMVHSGWKRSPSTQWRRIQFTAEMCRTEQHRHGQVDINKKCRHQPRSLFPSSPYCLSQRVGLFIESSIFRLHHYCRLSSSPLGTKTP